MSFLFTNSQNRSKKEKMNNKRKEEDSTKTQTITSYFPKHIERASLFTSLKGSITVETALTLPLFFVAIYCLCYLLDNVYSTDDKARHLMRWEEKLRWKHMQNRLFFGRT